MKDEILSEKLIDYLFGDIDGFEMEHLFTKLLELRHPGAFKPLGGRKDGGADGQFIGIYTQDESHFVQISREEGVEAKIKKTITRLRAVGRDPKALTYWTHRKFPMQDVVEDRLTDEFGVVIRIRDHASLIQLINHSPDTRRYVRTHFSRQLAELVEQRGATATDVSSFATDPTVYTYLKFQVSERGTRDTLITPVVDALIYWALRGTDPDQGKLLTRTELKDRIRDALPGAQNIVSPKIDSRLKQLRTKDNTGAQRIRFYTESDSFCLPYEMRLQIAEESANDIALTNSVRQSLADRAQAAGANTESQIVADVTLDVIYRHFHDQGLILAAFLEKRLETITLQEQVIEDELNGALQSEAVSEGAYRASLRVLQGFFYDPTDAELQFQRQLSKTSLLLVSLQHSPQLLEYFNKMTGRFNLIVGSDIIVKALSETFLPQDRQTVSNLLRVASEAGATLLLCEPVLEEVFTHFHATHQEFKNHYAQHEPFITPSLASESDRILIRTYFYAKFAKRVKGWRNYVDFFVDFDLLDKRQERGLTELGAYLTKSFGFSQITRDELSQGIDDGEREALASILTARDSAKNEALAQNDALMAHGVYAARKKNREAYKYDGFGLATWWLTKETRILAYTADLVRQHGTPYIMRPEFLLNFLALAPTTHLTERARELLPTHVGLQLGKHLPDYQMQTLLSAVDEWQDLPSGRVEIKLSNFADRLKFDRLKQYGSNLDLNGKAMFKNELARLQDEIRAERQQGD